MFSLEVICSLEISCSLEVICSLEVSWLVVLTEVVQVEYVAGVCVSSGGVCGWSVYEFRWSMWLECV